jgi:hypothetical protein
MCMSSDFGLEVSVKVSPKRPHQSTIQRLIIQWMSLASIHRLRSCRRSETRQPGRAAGGCVIHDLISVTTPTDALAEAVYYLNPWLSKGNPWRRGQEPNWIDVSTLIKLSTHFGFSNRSDIYAALSYRPKALKSLPELPNFFAHRNPDTYKIAMGIASKYGLSVQSPNELALAYVRNRPTTLLQDWIDDLIFVVEYLCT